MLVARTETILICGHAPIMPCPAAPAIIAIVVPWPPGRRRRRVPPSIALADTSPGWVSGLDVDAGVDEAERARGRPRAAARRRGTRRSPRGLRLTRAR